MNAADGARESLAALNAEREDRRVYKAIHLWLSRNYLRSGHCERCRKAGKTEYAFLRHPHPHTRERSDYIELCRSCHLKMDASSGARPANQYASGFRTTHCKRGHLRTPENTYRRPDGNGVNCRVCARENQARYNAAARRELWPPHQPECHDAPIPGRQWYSGCEPGGDWDYELGNYTGTGPRVNPATGRCESCDAEACSVCGRENCPDHEVVVPA